MFVATNFWYFLVVVTDYVEWKLSWSPGFGCLFWYSYFSAACHGPLMEPETEHIGPTLQKNQEDPNFVSFSGGSCGQTELVMLYKWSQLKVNDGALLLNLKDSSYRWFEEIDKKCWQRLLPLTSSPDFGAPKGRLLFSLQLGSKPSFLCHKEDFFK